MKLIIALLMQAVLLSACAVNPNTYERVEYKKGPPAKYPPIELIINDGNVRSLREGDYHEGIIEALVESELFLGLSTSNGYSPFLFEIEVDEKNDEHDVSNTVKIFASAATLFLVPMVYDMQFNMRASIKYKNKVIAEYEYVIKGRETGSLIHDPIVRTKQAMSVLISYLLRDLQNDTLFDLQKIKI
jgi:hypothetical protein